MNKQRPLCAAQGALFLSAVALAVLQRPRSHRLAEHAAEMGGGGKAGLLGHSADVQVGALQQALGSLDAAAIDVIHNGLARDPPEQPTQVIGRQVEPRSHICQGEFLLVVGCKVSADLFHRLVAGADVLLFTAALLLHIVQDEGQIDHAGAFRLAFGALHHAQQSAQAARPLHRAVQGRLCSRLKQRHEIPLHQVLEHRENARREPAADELRGNVARQGETLTLDFTTEAETFFVDASRYGLVADGTTDNTGKLQAALSTCPKGGTVYLPAGRYRTSSLFMKSCTTLYLEKGAVLLGDNDRTHYPILPGVIPSENEVDEYYLTGWEGNPLDSFAGLLNITQVHDVVVTGEGTLDCDAQNGDWWINQKVKRIAWRPRAVAAVDSENVCLHGITVQNSYSWTIHPIFVKHLDLLNFNINNPYNAPNTDGIDPESCEYIRIIGANIHVGDDCIAMKASKVFLGMKLKKSCEHTVIRNCLLDKGHGGIVIGSEMSGGVKDMVVTQCLMDHTDRGLRVKTRRGRGNTAVIDGLVFHNVEMRGVKAPFVINMFYFCDPDGHSPYVQCRDAMPVDEYTPKLGSLTMEDIVATDAQFAGCYFDGLPEQPIERVSMKNVTITFDPNAEAGQAAMADNRPNVKKLAIYAENVKEIDLHNVKITGYEGERLRFANVGHFEED